MPLPKFAVFFNPSLEAIKKQGGVASISEIQEEVIRVLHLSDDDVAEQHDNRTTKLQYELSWTRTYLKEYGLLDNPKRGIWVLTEEGKGTDTVDANEIIQSYNANHKAKKSKS